MAPDRMDTPRRNNTAWRMAHGTWTEIPCSGRALIRPRHPFGSSALVCDELDSWLQMAPEVKLAPISPYGKFFTVGKKLNRNLSGEVDPMRCGPR